MISPADKEYKETKLIKQGRKKLVAPFKELAEWINKEFGVNVLNVYYDLIKPDNKPRLNIIFEFSNDEKRFRTEPYGFYDTEKQKVIAEKFKELIEIENSKNKGLLVKLLNNKSISKCDTANVWVIFSSFESAARIEANKCIPQEKIQELKINLNNKDLWEISRCFSVTTFFFYTDRQVEENIRNGMREKLAEKYFNLLKLYDEFDYIKKDHYSVYIDSKENFDNNYQSNWYYYYK